MSGFPIYNKKKTKLRLPETKSEIETYFNNTVNIFKSYFLEEVNSEEDDWQNYLLIALSITAIFNVLIDYLLNEKSRFCIIPHKHREFEEIMDLNNNGDVSENEINKAIEILNKAKKTAKNKEIIKNMGYFSL